MLQALFVIVLLWILDGWYIGMDARNVEACGITFELEEFEGQSQGHQLIDLRAS